MPVPQEIIKLVERFESQREAYQSGKYNEAQIRAEFIDPFFKALGWDIHNEQGYAEAYKDVIHEDAIKISSATKAPDLCFRIGGTRKFFVECKKPSINIKDAVHPAYQLRRYAWSARLPLSILTDFDELAVYDCRAKPNKNDSASACRLMYLTGKQYAEKWDELAAIFSREAVLKGSFDKFAESAKGKKGTTGVDDAFLEEIERWRDLLAHNIAIRNEKLSQRELNFAVQRTIDRIIFLRICEDRGIEPYGRLLTLKNGERAYPRLGEFFRRADERYNSGIFCFTKNNEAGGEPPDELTLTLTIDDKIIKDIVGNLYYPESPYEFSVLPADILGQVYERFLGKVIRLTAGHQAKVEDKPEVRKAGGVYYTPTYIVDYIVKNTVGKLLEGKTPRQAAKLKILDPACGSGSFLLGAYQYLLNWHHDYYVQQMKVGSDRRADRGRPGRAASPIYQSSGGDYRLTTTERKRILLNNIFGVDIDTQAVEVTKLSLLLKVLEGESQETITKQFELFHQRALPDLGSNIKCGNSLIGPDFYQQQEMNLLDDESRYRINAFDWHAEFSEIMKSGGFDAVIGNPPWGSFVSQEEKQHFVSNYANKRGEAESHLFFIEKGLKLLNPNGALGYITPNTWLSVLNSREIRRFLLANASFLEIVELSKYIFEDAPDIVPILIFLSADFSDKAVCNVKRSRVVKVTGTNFREVFALDKISQKTWAQHPHSVINLRLSLSVQNLLEHCKRAAMPLGEICTVLYGIKTGDNAKYLSRVPTRLHRVKALKTGELIRYSITWKKFYLWWCRDLAGYRESSVEIPKIVVQYIRKISLPRRLISALDTEGIYYPLNNYSYIVTQDPAYSLKYIQGILNSSLLNFFFANTFIDYNIKPTYLQQIPIHRINPSDSSDKIQHDRMVTLVDQMLDLHKKLAEAKAPHDKESLQRQISTTDREIDRLVYDLYGLTKEEIEIIENNR